MEKTKIKDLITTEIERTKKAIQSYEDSTQPVGPENSIGRVSRMDAINNKSVTEASLRQARLRLSSLETALSKVDTESFGKCKRCGSGIPVGRLLIIPESKYCVNCV